jgi:hypothetical protein
MVTSLNITPVASGESLNVSESKWYDGLCALNKEATMTMIEKMLLAQAKMTIAREVKDIQKNSLHHSSDPHVLHFLASVRELQRCVTQVEEEDFLASQQEQDPH